jgi:hypothetical protein
MNMYMYQMISAHIIICKVEDMLVKQKQKLTLWQLHRSIDYAETMYQLIAYK